MSPVPEITPKELAERWGGPDGTEIVLLDVREAPELELARIEGALHLPMSEIQKRVGELDSGRTYVVMCHGGVRSERVAAFLKTNGFPRVFNLAGGIDAWSLQVDAGVPRY